METADLANQLDGRSAAGHAELASCLREVGLNGCGRQAKPLGDLGSLKMIGHALQASPLLGGEALKSINDF